MRAVSRLDLGACQGGDQRDADVGHVTGGVLDRTEQPRWLHLIGGDAEFLGQFGQHLRAQVHRAVGP